MHLPVCPKATMTHSAREKRTRRSGAIIVLLSQSSFFSWAHYEKEITVTHRKINIYTQEERSGTLFKRLMTRLGLGSIFYLKKISSCVFEMQSILS